MADYPSPPGSLSTLGKIWEGAKHLGKKALKWGATIAVVGGVIGMLVAGPFAAVAGLLNTVTFGLSGALGIAGGTTLTSGLSSGLGLGAIVGGALGAVSGAGGVIDAVEEANERNIATVQRAENRAMQAAAMEQQYTQKQIALAQQAQQLGGQALPGIGQGMSRR